MKIPDRRIDMLIPLGGNGGVEKVVNKVACYLHEQGIVIRIVQFIYEGNPWVDPRIPFFSLLGTNKVGHIREFSGVYARFLEETYTPDVVIAIPWPFLSWTAREALELTQGHAKVISWMHGPLKEYEKYELGGWEYLQYADAHMVVNRTTYDFLKENCPKSNVKLVHNPVDFQRCQKYEPHYEENEYIALYVGRLSEEKRVDVIIQALANTSEKWKLHIIGAGSEKAKLDQMIEELDLCERVSYLGWKENPWEAADGARVLIVASEYESFCLAGAEALAYGIPVISTPVEGIDEYLISEENGYFMEHNNPHQLTQLLDDMAEGSLPSITKESCRNSVNAFEEQNYLQEIYQWLEYMIDESRKLFTTEQWRELYYGLNEIELSADTTKVIDIIEREIVSLSEVRKMIAVCGEQKWKIYKQLADSYKKQGHLVDAIQLYEDANHEMPGEQTALLGMAEIFLMAGKKEQTVQALEAIANPNEEVLQMIEQLKH